MAQLGNSPFPLSIAGSRILGVEVQGCLPLDQTNLSIQRHRREGKKAPDLPAPKAGSREVPLPGPSSSRPPPARDQLSSGRNGVRKPQRKHPFSPLPGRPNARHSCQQPARLGAHSKADRPAHLPRLFGYRAVAPPLKRPFRPARGGFRRPSNEADGGARHLPRAVAAPFGARAALAPRHAAKSRHGPGAPREDRDHARPRRRDALLRRTADRARQARRHGPAGHAPGRLLADGEGPAAQALQGAGAPLRAPPGRLHADGADPQERQPEPGREGGDRVQGQPAPAAAAAPSGRREDAGQPAAEGLPGGAAPRRRHGRVTSPLGE